MTTTPDNGAEATTDREVVDPVILGQVVDLLRTTLSPTVELLGHDLAGPLEARIPTRAHTLTAALSGADPHQASRTAKILLAQFVDPDPELWATALGGAIARALDQPPHVSVIGAATILGITRSAVYQAINRGHIPHDADGGLPVVNVLDRLANMTTVRRHR